MALSNWDTMALDENGEPTNGVMEGCSEGASCEIYKNWLYVRDREMWCDGRGYVEPTIAKVDSGSVMVSDFEIEAIRGPQSAIFVKVTSMRYKEKVEGEAYRELEVRRMGGIGCSGYEDPHERVMDDEGLDPEEWTFDGHGSVSKSDGTWDLYFSFHKNPPEGERPSQYKEIKRPEGKGYDTDWVGVKESTHKEFIAWLKSDEDYRWDDDYKVWVDKIEKAEALRFNQGDMYFADHVGTPLNATPPGQQKPTMMSHIVESMKEKPTNAEKE